MRGHCHGWGVEMGGGLEARVCDHAGGQQDVEERQAAS